MTNRRTKQASSALAILAGIAVGMVLGMGETGEAHTASTYIPDEWAADPYYYFGDIDSPLDGSTAKTSIHAGDDPWNSNSGTWLDFINSGYQDSSVQFTGYACTTGSGTAVWIVTASMSSLGRTNLCTDSGTITRAAIRLDDTRSNWYVGSSSNVPSNQYDLRSVIVHEFGHAGGFLPSTNDGHWDGVGEDCTGTDRETMCGGLPRGTSYKRTIELHENHTFDSAY